MDSSKFTLHLIHHAVNSTASNSDEQQSSNDSELFEQKLFDLTEQLSSSGYSQPSILSNLVVESAVVSNHHLAFLLDNGHVCRVNYQYTGSGLTVPENPPTTNTSSSSSSRKHSKLSTLSSGLGNSSSGSFRSSSRTLSSSSFVAAAAAAVAAATNAVTNPPNSNSTSSSSTGNQNTNTSQTSSSSTTGGNNALLRANEAFIIPSPHDILSSSSLSHGFGRGRRNQLLRSRVSNLIVGSSRMPPFVPASAVPESLIESVQTVLQSKSRSIIIRELQRTNLDVNLAVNNLLQRDDEGDDPTDDEDPYMHGDDLISLLDINSHHGESVLLDADGTLFDEDSFRLSRRLGSSRTHGTSANANSSSSNATTTSSNTANSATAPEQPDRSTESSRKSSYRIRDQRWYDSYRDELFSNTTSNLTSSSHHSSHHRSSSNPLSEHSNVIADKTDDEKKKNSSWQFSFGERLQYWTDKDGEPIKFIKLKGMFSELIGVSNDGKLHQWKWVSETPYFLSINIPNEQTSTAQPQSSFTVHHPKTLFLQLLNEKIVGLASSNVRASCWTESGKIASWLDETLDVPSTIKYQTPAQIFLPNNDSSHHQSDSQQQPIILEMSTSNLFTLIRMSSGSIYWWGVMPFEQRAKLIDKYQSKLQKSKSSSSGNEITVGSYVSLKSLPLYNHGTIGFTVKDGQPRIGQINEHVFMFRDSKAFKFKLRTTESLTNGSSVEMPPPPSPSNVPPQPPPPPAPLTGSLKRKKQYISISDLSNIDKTPRQVDDEEYWQLSDVVFVEDFKSSSVLGKVIKIDNEYVLVQVSVSKSNETGTDTANETVLLDNSRIFQKSQLQLINQSSSVKLPDFMQKSPKKLSDFGAILTVSAHQNGLHAIITKENSLFYVQYDLLSNKITKEKRFTTSLSSFLGRNLGNISFFAPDDPILNQTSLFDGNSTLYPLAELSGSNTLKNPEWKNLFPMKCFSQCLIPSPQTRTSSKHSSTSNKKLNCVTFFAMRMEQLMSSIYRYDLSRVTKIIKQLETDMNIGPNAVTNTPVNSKRLKKILNERCDGNRNILHAAVYICAPVSNNTLAAIHTTAPATAKNSSNVAGNSLRPSRFSESGLSDIYAAYGSQSSSSSSTKPTAIERPWSTSNKTPEGTNRKISISLDPKPQESTATTAATSSNPATPVEPKSSSEGSSGSSEKILLTSFWPPLPPAAETAQSTPPTAAVEDKMTQIWTPVKLSEKERKQNAIKILQELLNSPVFSLYQPASTGSDHLNDLLSHKSADGQTPFMYAVNIRAYEAALLIFDQALKMRSNYVQNQLNQSPGNFNSLAYSRDILFTNLIFPLGSRTDQSPLYVLCSNDTCSFTWTGDNHITQDIFECRTCTLVGNLCCCTECARTCHKGHDCKIKTSSPTAYCDCWEKCKCKSLIAGDQEKRFTLLEKLLAETNLLSASNFRGESLLIYLAQTVSRQIQEQRNYKRVGGTISSSSSSTASSTSSRRNGYNSESSSSSLGITGSIGYMPQHDLEPPKFSRRALEKVFTDWNSVKQIFFFNKSRIDTAKLNDSEPKLPSFLLGTGTLIFDESVYSDAQSGCVDLDKFMYILIIKCPSDPVTVLVDTVQKKLACTSGDKDEQNEAEYIARRLIRAVTRLFVILCIETSPSNLSVNLSIANGAAAITSLSSTSNSTTNRTSSVMSPTRAVNSRLARFKSLNSTNQTQSCQQIASLVTISPLAKCEYILRQFAKYSIEELADNAHSLIMPVVLGLTKPSTFKLSAQQTNNGASSGSFNGNTDYVSIGSNVNSGTSSQYALAEEVFNLESPSQRQFSSSISTTLITPAPLVKKQANDAAKTPTNFINSFESVPSKVEKKETATTAMKSNVAMPPPTATASSQAHSHSNPPQPTDPTFIDSDTNNSSSSSSSSGSNPRNKTKSSHISRMSISVNSNSENSNSNSSSGESSSSEANSSDTATSLATASSTSTAYTKRSTTALKSGRNRKLSMTKKNSSRTVQFSAAGFNRKTSEGTSNDQYYSDKEDENDADDADEEDDDDEDDDEDDDDDDEDDDDNMIDEHMNEEYENEILSPDEQHALINQNLDDDFIHPANIEEATNSSESSAVNISTNTTNKPRRLLSNRSNSSSTGNNSVNPPHDQPLITRHLIDRTESNIINSLVNSSSASRAPAIIDTTVPPPYFVRRSSDANLVDNDDDDDNTDDNNDDDDEQTSNDEIEIKPKRKANEINDRAISLIKMETIEKPLPNRTNLSVPDSRLSIGSNNAHRRFISSSSLNNLIQQYNVETSTTSSSQQGSSDSSHRLSSTNHHSNRSTISDYSYTAQTRGGSTTPLTNSNNPNHNTNNNLNNPTYLAETPYNIMNTSTAAQQPAPQQHYTTITAIPTSNSSISGPINQNESISSYNTPSSNAITNNTLTRVFSLLVKLIRELITSVYTESRQPSNQSYKKSPGKSNKRSDSSEDSLNLQNLRELIMRVNEKLESPWQWLVSLMDATEAQLRFGASLSSSQGDLGSNNNALQYLRHLEERALLTNYFNNNYGNNNTSGQNSGYYNYYSNNTVGGGTGPFISSRFGSGIDARRKLNIMQHQHQQFASQHGNSPSIPSSYYANQAPPPPPLPTTTPSSSQGSTFPPRPSNNSSSISGAQDLVSNPSTNQQLPPAPSSSSQSGQSSNQAAVTLASQFASSQILTTRKDFLSYTLSLMRANSNEHRDSLPTIDISLLKHAAYVFDGIMFYLRTNSSSCEQNSKVASTTSVAVEYDAEIESNMSMDSGSESDSELDFLPGSGEFKSSDKSANVEAIMDEPYYSYEIMNEPSSETDQATDIIKDFDEAEDTSDTCETDPHLPNTKDLKSISSRDSTFFRRSSSTLCLGGCAPDPFYYTLEESLPLATRPHLLQPHVRIQDMFRVKSNDVDQFLSLNKMGLISSGLRSQAPYLKGPSLRSHKPLKKFKHDPETFKKIKFKKSDFDKTKRTGHNTNDLLSRLQRQLLKVSKLNTYKKCSQSVLSKPSELLDRWRLTVDLFGRVFCDDVGLEPGSIIRQLGGFQLKEAKFRREMERLRNTANRELLMEVERERDMLLQMTFKSLNNMYNLQNNRRAAASASLTSSSSSSSSNILPPLLCLNRIKVTFRDEQGEGSGVARSYYTAFSEAVLADVQLPNLDAFYNQSTFPSSSSSSSLGNVSYVPFNMLHRYRNTRGIDTGRRASSTPSTPMASSIPVSTTPPYNSSSVTPTRTSIRSRDPTPENTDSTSTTALSMNAPAFYSPLIAITSANLTDLPSFDLGFYNSLDIQHREFGQQLYAKINQSLVSAGQNTNTSFKAAKIAGMILELRTSQIQQLINSEPLLKTRIDEGIGLIANSQPPQSPTNAQEPTTPTYTSTINVQLATNKPSTPADNSPLFWQPNKSMAGAGFYALRAGLNTQPRLNAFRNVGRIMAICLLQNELCPITLTRHCVKFILGRPVKWHDLAFFDSQMYESFRKMIKDAEEMLIAGMSTNESAFVEIVAKVNEELFKPLDLTFNIDLPKEEGGSNHDLIENGSKILVDCLNMYEFVRKYAEFRMVKHVEQCLQELKNGIYDVLPANAFEGMTPEDFRLLLNGVADISIHTLASYTTISDESKESNRRPQFEKWFWATLEKMTQQEKQELLFFWTGSPYLPASEEGFQPLPTVTLRPPSDQHLPTANTCINRLYLPMYSSKSILKSKILQAIKTKTFGFV